MSERNPYTLNFGKIPKCYISRDVLIDEIIDNLCADSPDDQAFKLTGIRGTGKTVTLTAIENKLRLDEKWIVIDLKSNSDITTDLVAALYDEVPFLTEFIDKSLNLSAFGIGLSLSQKSPVASIDFALKKLLEYAKKKNHRVLVVIDEARKTDALVDFIQEFQILIREDLPIYMLVAGLYEDIESIENADGLTFFLRAEKYEMMPLSTDIIREEYKETLKISDEHASKLALMTKGYAYAYQVIGKYMWDSHGNEANGMVLAQIDEALSRKVYDKIWSELKPQDKWFLSFIVRKDKMSVSELLEVTSKKHNEWSEPRKRLIEKGVIDGSVRGVISIRLPRFREYVEKEYAE